MRAEEERRLQHRLVQETEARDSRLQQLLSLEKAIKESLVQQDKLAEQEIDEMKRDFELQTKIEKQIIQSRVEDEELHDLEFKATQRLHEVTDMRNKEERARKVRMELDYVDRQKRLRDHIWEENLRAEDEEFKLRMDLLRQNKLNELYRQQEINDKKELDLKLVMEGLEKDLKIKDVERERKLRRIAQEEVFKNEEYMKYHRKQEEAALEEEQKYLQRVMEEEKRTMMRQTEEKLAQIEHEKRHLTKDLMSYNETLKEKGMEQQRKIFEDKITALRKEKQLDLIEEEKELQKTLLDIEEQRRFQKEMMNDLLEKEREYQEKQELYHTLRWQEEKALEEERHRFGEFREGTREELNKIEDARERVLEARLTQLRTQNEELFQTHAEEMRKNIQKENLLRYYEDGKSREWDEQNSQSVYDDNQRSWNSRGNTSRFDGKIIIKKQLD